MPIQIDTKQNPGNGDIERVEAENEQGVCGVGRIYGRGEGRSLYQLEEEDGGK